MFEANLTGLDSAYSIHYNVAMLLMSVLIISLVTYVAFSIAVRVEKARVTSVWSWRSWWLAGSVILGLCVWSAQFVYMLAFELPVPVHYDLQLTLLSVIPAILASSLLLKVDSAARQGYAMQWMIATAVGGGMVLVHYMGMAAMRMNALINFDSTRLLAAVLLTILLAYFAVWVKCKIQQSSGQQQALTPEIPWMAAAMAGLIIAVNHSFHFASTYIPNPGGLDLSGTSLISSQVLISVATATVGGILVLLFAAVQFGYRADLATMLKERSAFIDGVLDASMEAIISIDALGSISGFNKAAESMFQYKAGNVIGRNFLFLLPAEVRNLLEQSLSDCSQDISASIHRVHEVNALRADGTEFPAEVSFGPVEDHGAIGFVGTVRDISRQKLADEERIKAHDRLETLLQASPVVLYTCAVSGGMPIDYVSPTVRKLFGFDPDVICASPVFWFNRMHPDDQERLGADRKSLRKTGRDYREYRIKLSDERYRWVSDTQTLVYDDSGAPLLLVGSWADIHQRKVSELNLAVVQERLDISLGLGGMCTWDWIMHSGEFRWCEHMAGKLGMAEEYKQGFDQYISMVHSEDRSKVRAAFRQSLVRGDALDEEYRVVSPDRSVHWMHSVGHLINDELGHPLHMVGVTEDVTADKQLHLAPRLSAKIG